MGNPTKYLGNTLTWELGRRLTRYNDIAYTYNSTGLRESKTANGINTKYTYIDNKLFREVSSKHDIRYLYGLDGITGISIDNVEYTYRKNLQGDITHILDMSGTVVARYIYDAWGNHKAYMCYGDSHELVYDSATRKEIDITELMSKGAFGQTIPMLFGGAAIETNAETIRNSIVALINPIRYRGYYYDSETGLFYCTSRYYDPEVGRFISADDISYLDPETLNGLNLYAYCLNNPVMLTDSSGTYPTGFQGLFMLGERFFTGLSELCRYLVKNGPKIIGHTTKIGGIGRRAAQRAENAAYAQTKSMSKTFGKIAKVAAFATLALDIGTSWHNNFNSGSATWVSDSIVDTAYIGARFAIGWGITAAFSLIPGVGWLIGIGVSIGVDYLIKWVMESGALDAVKTWAAGVGQSISNGWNNFVSGWNNFWSFNWI